MFAYNPQVVDQSGAIVGAAKAQAAQTKADAQVKLVDDIGGALVSLAGAYAGASQKRKDQKNLFDGTYNFLNERNMISPSAQAAIGGFMKNKDYSAANAYIAPYLAELDFGRKSMLAGRSGFFDDSGNWQMAMPATAASKSVTF